MLRTFTSPLGRGVFVTPWCGPNGEIILVAVTSRNRKVDEITIPIGASHADASDALWQRLEEAEPFPLQIVR